MPELDALGLIPWLRFGLLKVPFIFGTLYQDRRRWLRDLDSVAWRPGLVRVTFGAHVLTFFWRFGNGYGYHLSSGGCVSWSGELPSFERTAFAITP